MQLYFVTTLLCAHYCHTSSIFLYLENKNKKTKHMNTRESRGWTQVVNELCLRDEFGYYWSSILNDRTICGLSITYLLTEHKLV